MCWDIVMVVAYGLERSMGSLVVDKDLRVMLLNMDRLVVGYE